jgi:hypothetical protein
MINKEGEQGGRGVEAKKFTKHVSHATLQNTAAKARLVLFLCSSYLIMYRYGSVEPHKASKASNITKAKRVPKMD